MKIFDVANLICKAIYTEKKQETLVINASWYYKITIEKIEQKERWEKANIIFIDEIPKKLT